MERFWWKNKNNIYLDNWASTLALYDVKKSVDSFLLNYWSVHRWSWYNSEISTKLYEQSRNQILKYLDGNKKDDAVIFTANTTDWINKFVLMSNYKKVLISDIEHSSNRLPREKACEVVELKTNNFMIDLSELEKKLKSDSDIDIVALTAASNITWYVSDIKWIYEICKKYNVIFFLDASQYAPHFKPSLKDCDVIVYCWHKMYAPYWAGVLAWKKYLFENDNHALTWGWNVLYAWNEWVVYKNIPYMHESWTPNWIWCVAMCKAHDILYKKIGEKKLREHNQALVDAIDSCCEKLEHAWYKVYFWRKIKWVERTPILVLSNTKYSNKKTVELLNMEIGKYKKNIFCREWAFCAYKLIEQLIPCSDEKIMRDGKPINVKNLKILWKNRYVSEENDYLSNKFSLIRFSAWLINTPNDIIYLTNKLIEINLQTKK